MTDERLCIVCARPTDTALAFYGKRQHFADFLATLDVPLARLWAVVDEAGVTEDAPKRVGVWLCSGCAFRAGQHRVVEPGPETLVPVIRHRSEHWPAPPLPAEETR